MDPENIHLGVEIQNPDLIIDNLIEHLNNKGVDSNWLFTVKDFNQDEKVKWILSLPDASSIVAEDSFNFPVTIYNRFMLKVAETVSSNRCTKKRGRKNYRKMYRTNLVPQRRTLTFFASLLLMDSIGGEIL